jgi:hypothetical protein
MAALTLTGSLINFYVNNTVYKVAQTVTLEVDYGEDAIYGIDSPWPQEIAGGRISIRGSVKGLRIKNSGGLQAFNLRPLFTDMAASPYISIRIQDRSTMEDIVLITNAKVSNEILTAPAKGVYRLDFNFIGQQTLFALDRS